MPNYSAAEYYNTFNGGASRTALADNIKAEMVLAGWTVASGSSGDWTLDSATTPNGLACRARVFDPGSGSCARIQCSRIDGTLTLSTKPIFLLPDAGETWHIYANPYAVCMQVIPWPNVTRKWCFFGTGFTPDFFHDGSPAECLHSIIQCSGSQEDNGTNSGSVADLSNALTQGRVIGWIWNALSRNIANETASAPTVAAPYLPASSTTPVRWAVDDSRQVSDLALSWSTAGFADITEQRIRLLPFDAIVIAGQYNVGDLAEFDSREWACITHQLPQAGIFFLRGGTSPA